MMTKQQLEKNARELEALEEVEQNKYLQAMRLKMQATQSATDAATKTKRIHIQLMRLRGELAMVEDE